MKKQFIMIISILFLTAVMVLFFVIKSNENNFSKNIDSEISEDVKNILHTTKLATLSEADYSAIKISGKFIYENVFFSPDGLRVAYIIQRGSKSSVFTNNIEGGWYDSIDKFTVNFSEDGKHLAYIGVRGDQHYLIIDGKEQPMSGQGLRVYLSNNLDHIAYTEQGEDKKRVNFGDKFGNYYDNIYDLTLDPDGALIAYYGCNHYAEDYSSECLFITQDLSGNKQERSAFSSGDNFNSLDFSWHSEIKFSPSGNIIAYIQRMYGSDRLVVNNNELYLPELGDYEKNNIQSFVFSPDGNHLAYIVKTCNSKTDCSMWSAENGEKYHILLDNEVLNSYDEARELVFSQDSGTLSYFARKGVKWFLIIDGKELLIPFDDVQAPVVILHNPKDNKIIYMYLTSNDKISIVRNGEIIASDKLLLFPSFTPNGNFIYINAKANDSEIKMTLVINGEEKTEYDGIFPILSSVEDPFDGSAYIYISDNKVMYGAIKENELWIVTEPF